MADEFDESAAGGRTDVGVPARRSLALGPEGVAIVLVVMAIAVVTAGLLLGGPASPSTNGNASPSRAASAQTTPAPTTSIDVADITACLDIDARLLEDRAGLQAELEAPVFAPTNVAALFRKANADLLSAIGVAARLEREAPTAEIGATLSATYGDLHREVSDALGNSVQFTKAYHAAATSVAAGLARLEALDVVLRGLRDQAGATPRPSPSAPPSAVPPSARPTPTQSSGPGPSGSSGPSATPAPAGLVNAGFEAGVGPPWELLLAPGSAATLQADPTVRASGSSAARVDIAVSGDERAAVAVRQGGLGLVAGSHYIGSIAVRTESTREVRLRIASASGDSYATRLYTVGPAWQTLTVDFTVFATDPNAYLEIDLGRSTVTTWLDDATFATVAATPG